MLSLQEQGAALDHLAGLSALSPMWQRALDNGGNRVCAHPQAFADLVSGDMARDESEAWCQRTGSSARPGPGQLPDGLDLVAQVETRHGQTGPRTAPRIGRGR